jgi:transcriptional regulator with XRE-family HTH domain
MLSFGKIIRDQRAALGMTQARLAELVGETTSAVRSWEREQAIPGDPATLQSLSAVLGVDPEMLLEPAREAGYVEPLVEISKGVRLLGAGSSLDALRTPPPENNDVTELTSPIEKLETAQEEIESVDAVELWEPEASTEAIQAPIVVTPTSTMVQQSTHEVGASPRRKRTQRRTPVASNYLDDPREIRRYRLRALYTLTATVASLIVIRYAMGEVGESVSSIWATFSERVRF